MASIEMKWGSASSLLLGGMLMLCHGCIDDVQLEGKGCPCLDSHVCDSVLDVCVLPGSPGAGQPDAAVKPRNLRAEWSTSNSIRWSWDLGEADAPDQLSGYRLVVSSSEASVLSEQDALIFAGSVGVASDPLFVNPELGRYSLPRTTGSDPLVATITDLHEADEVVFARLVATDTAGHQWATNVAQARTTIAPSDEIVLFSEAQLGGVSIPPSYQRTMGDPFSGSYHYEWINDQNLPFEQLRQQPEPDIDVSRVSEGSFGSTAFFEVAVRLDAEAPSFWSEVWLRFPDDFHARFAPLTVRNGDSYRVIQLPLRVLAEKADPPVFLDDARMTVVNEISVGGQWSAGAIVRVDEIRIRW